MGDRDLRACHCLIRGLLEWLVPSLSKHQNTGVESVSIIQNATKGRNHMAWKSKPRSDIQATSQNSKWVGVSNPHKIQNEFEYPIPAKLPLCAREMDSSGPYLFRSDLRLMLLFFRVQARRPARPAPPEPTPHPQVQSFRPLSPDPLHGVTAWYGGMRGWVDAAPLVFGPASYPDCPLFVRVRCCCILSEQSHHTQTWRACKF